MNKTKNSVNAIRSKFINYFNKNDHEVITSSNLVPNNDPTLLLQMQVWYSLKMFLLV